MILHPKRQYLEKEMKNKLDPAGNSCCVAVQSVLVKPMPYPIPLQMLRGFKSLLVPRLPQTALQRG